MRVVCRLLLAASPCIELISWSLARSGIILMRAAAERLEIVECDLEKQPQESIVKAIGNASLVVCAIGASEKEILDVTGPYRIDYSATSNLVQAGTYIIYHIYTSPLHVNY